ncbi:carboxylating nicotinate-nucleotide diphosphorylase, partial [Neisseria gonorrhoeae]
MPSENPLFALPDTLLRPMVEQALSEDLGRRGDITSAAVIAPDKTAKLFLVSREDGVIAGMDLARLAFQTMDPCVRFQAEIQDGQAVRAGQTLAAVEGNARAL